MREDPVKIQATKQVYAIQNNSGRKLQKLRITKLSKNRDFSKLFVPCLLE